MAETKITKGRGGKNNFLNAQPLNVDAGDNTKYLAHAMTVQAMPPIDIADVEQVRQRIHDYFVLCGQNDMKPTVTGFCNALKVARSTLWEWKQGNFRKNTHQAVILEAYAMLEALWEDYMQNGKINPVSGIFLGKNNFGYTDKQEYVVTPNTTAVQSVEPTIIAEKYAELPEV